MEIKIVDQIMGAGKSTSVMRMINESGDEKRFLYITPYLDEVKRVKTRCAAKCFVEPKVDEEVGNTKLYSLKELISCGRNIVSTHALFHLFDATTARLIKEKGYTLIMDEVTNVIDIVNMSSGDLKAMVKSGYISYDDKEIIWNMKDYDGELRKLKKYCSYGTMIEYAPNTMLWIYPIEVFESFEDVYILTYMFDAQIQRYYFDYYKCTYKYLYVKKSGRGYVLTEEPQVYKFDFTQLINVLDNKKMNSVGDKPFSLSKSWYKSPGNRKNVEKLKNNCNNFFRNICNTKSASNMWTTFKAFEKKVSGKGYSNGFIPLNARATNKFANCSSVAYLVNIYMNPMIMHYFLESGVEIDQDRYALSDMLQWLWRGQIRKGKPINAYIPSKRMRTLLLDWMEDIKP